MRLTEKTIGRIKAPSKRIQLAAGESLYLRVQPTGRKTWVLRVARGGKVRDITLGAWPALTVLQARQAAHLKRKELEIKPSAGVTLADAYRLWKSKKRGSIVSFNDECARIERHIMPALGRLELEQVTAPVALNLLMGLRGKPPTLKRVLMRLNEMLELAVCAGLLLQNPCRRLGRLFAEHRPVHRPYIPAQRLGELFALLADEPLWFHCFVLWAVYSLLRPGECCAVRWSWIEGSTLTLPPEIMKKRRQHRVPLPPGVLALLEVAKGERKRRSQSVWAFGRGGAPVNKQHLAKWLNASPLKGQLCHHGLRATGRTWMRDQGVAWEVAEDALAHLGGTATERAYLRGDYLEQRRAVMARWWSFVWRSYCAGCADCEPRNVLIAALEPDNS